MIDGSRPKNAQNRSISVLVLALAIATLAGVGCSNDPTPPSSSIPDAIHDMEDRGELPVLDRTDTLLGFDSDGNGVRDDLDRVVDEYDDTDPQRRSLRQLARALGSALTVAKNDEVAVANAFRSVSDAVDCAYSVYDSDLAALRTTALESMTINTMVRIRAYDEYLAAIDGASIELFRSGTCHD